MLPLGNCSGSRWIASRIVAQALGQRICIPPDTSNGQGSQRFGPDQSTCQSEKTADRGLFNHLLLTGPVNRPGRRQRAAFVKNKRQLARSVAGSLIWMPTRSRAIRSTGCLSHCYPVPNRVYQVKYSTPPQSCPITMMSASRLPCHWGPGPTMASIVVNASATSARIYKFEVLAGGAGPHSLTGCAYRSCFVKAEQTEDTYHHRNWICEDAVG